MKLLVFGTTGQVSQEIARNLPGDSTMVALGRAEADLTDPAACADAIAKADCDAVINAAAYTAVDKAEEDHITAQRVNADAPGAMARACAARDIPFVHISTDYVFHGNGDAPFTPDDVAGPLGIYGATKLAGEEAIRASGAQHVILRTSWVFSSFGANFVRTMLRLAETRYALSIVADQVGGPTPAADIARTVINIAGQLVNGAPGGTYHFSGAPDVSWAEFADAIFRTAGKTVAITPIPTSDYPTPARRPLNSRLDCTTLTQDFGIERPDWQAGLHAVLKDLS